MVVLLLLWAGVQKVACIGFECFTTGWPYDHWIFVLNKLCDIECVGPSLVQVRKAFRAEPGNALVVADYGQLELRLLAHMAGCDSMLTAFRRVHMPAMFLC